MKTTECKLVAECDYCGECQQFIAEKLATCYGDAKDADWKLSMNGRKPDFCPKHRHKPCGRDECKAKLDRGSQEKYCKPCKKIVAGELKTSGFLEKKPHTAYRSGDQQENTHETKHGTGH